MNIFHMKCVLAVAEYRSFTKSARELFVSQSTLSNIIHKIEDEYGTPLFDRSTIPLKLTYAGELFVAHAKEITSISENMKRKLQEISNNSLGRIRIGMTQNRLPYILPLLIDSYSKKYPSIKVQGSVHSLYEIIEDIESQKIDFGIVPNFQGTLDLGKNVAQENLCQEKLILVSSAKYVTPTDTIPGLPNAIDIDALSHIPIAMLPENHYISSVIDRIFSQRNVTPLVALEINNYISGYRLATAGFCSMIVPETMTYWVRPSKKVSYYSLSSCPISWTVQVIYNNKLYMGKIEYDFIATLRNILSTRT